MTPELPHAFPSVVHMLADAARRAPGHTALVCGEETLSYLEFAACVSALAHRLQQQGIGAGQRIALVMHNSVDIAIATFGVQAAGAQVVPLNPAYTASELAPMLADADVGAIIYDSAVAATLQALVAHLPPSRLIEVGTRAERLSDARGRTELAASLPLPEPDELSTLQYTGGTTGRAKGVNLTHRSVAINVSQREALLPTEPEAERILAITPLFHVYAVSMGLYLAAYCRGTLVIMPRYRPDTVLAAIDAHRITLLSGSPTIFIGLMSYEGFAKARLDSLRLCFSGASALSEVTLSRWESATGCTVVEGYGQSEAGPVLTYNPRHGLRKLGSVGHPVPLTEVQIVDTATGHVVLAAGEIGEIRARGPQIMQSYRNLPQETAQTLRDGWLYTSDIGELDADGYLFIRDRKKEMAIVGGFNVYPREVEDALFSHPAVDDVAVVGVPDDYRGEALVACVVTRDAQIDADVLLEYLSARLVKYKIPREIRFLDALPRTTIGKTDKNRLRADLKTSLS